MHGPRGTNIAARQTRLRGIVRGSSGRRVEFPADKVGAARGSGGGDAGEVTDSLI